MAKRDYALPRGKEKQEGWWLQWLRDLMEKDGEPHFGSSLCFLGSWFHIPFQSLCGEFHSPESTETMHKTLTKHNSKEPKIKALWAPCQLTGVVALTTGSKLNLHYRGKHLRRVRGCLTGDDLGIWQQQIQIPFPTTSARPHCFLCIVISKKEARSSWCSNHTQSKTL